MELIFVVEAEAEAEVIKGCCGQPESKCDCVKEN